MDLSQIIDNEFNFYVKKTFSNENVRSFLLNHERRHILQTNVKKQIDSSSFIINSLNKSHEEKKQLVKMIAIDFAKAFCRVAIEVKHGELLKSSKTIQQAIDEEIYEDGSQLIV